MVKVISFAGITFNLVIGFIQLYQGDLVAAALLISLGLAMIVVTIWHLKELKRLKAIMADNERELRAAAIHNRNLLEEWQHAGNPTLQELCERKKDGVWFVRSEIDPRWNAQGNTQWLVSLGMPPEARAWIDECENKFDVGPTPSDLMYGFEKY